MAPKAAVFCQNGLGHGINTLVLSNNLQLNGYEVQTYQNEMSSLQNWVPHLPVSIYPPIEEIPKILHQYDLYFVIWNDLDPFILKLVAEGQSRCPEKMRILYLHTKPKKTVEYADCLTDPKASVAKNMRLVCEKVMHLPKISKSNGFIAPEGLAFRKHSVRVAIHPTSSNTCHSWPKSKYVKLALHLKKIGLRPVFTLAEKELEDWKDVLLLGLEIASFSTLDALSKFIYESGYMIGNNSGPVHLASALGIQTLTLCKRKTTAKMLAPSFVNGVILAPNPLIPNMRGMRLRDHFWQHFITVGMACRAFDRLRQLVVT